MNIFSPILGGFLLLSGPAFSADSLPVAPFKTVDPIVEALPILESKCVDFKALNYKPGDHLSDLISRSHGAISLGAPEPISQSNPILTATLPDQVLYWRLASFTPKTNWSDLEAALPPIAPNPSTGAILDLRSTISPADMAGAAQILTYFDPHDDSLSQFRGRLSPGKSAPSFSGPMVVLINRQTVGAAEILAARLKADGAVLLGRETAGQGAVFEEQKLSSGEILRYVVAHNNLADGNDLWGHPIAPDLALQVDERSEKAALTLIRDNHVLDVIQESSERHRLSEATLVQGQDPEWDDYLASLEKKPFLLSLPVIHDAALIRALDSLKAIQLCQRTAPLPVHAAATTPLSTSVQ